MPYSNHIDPDERFLTLRESARILGMTYNALRYCYTNNWLVDEDGNIPYEKPPGKGPGNRFKFSFNDLKTIAHILRRKNCIDNKNLELLITRIDLLATPIRFRTPLTVSAERRLENLGDRRKN